MSLEALADNPTPAMKGQAQKFFSHTHVDQVLEKRVAVGRVFHFFRLLTGFGSEWVFRDSPEREEGPYFIDLKDGEKKYVAAAKIISYLKEEKGITLNGNAKNVVEAAITAWVSIHPEYAKRYLQNQQ